jgi:hypothetical protein
MDLLSPRAGSDGKTYFTKIGVAFETKAGGWSLSFEALPLPSLNDKGQLETRVLMMLPRDNAGTSPQRGAPQQRGRVDDDLDDSVPF